MKTFALKSLAVALAAIAVCSTMNAEVWETNYEKAVASAKDSKKLVLMDFTGSDWCSWCMKLDKEVFSQPAFKDYAKDNLVLLKLDFPRSKQLALSEKQQNEKLAKEYSIEGYPTVVVLNAEGKKVGELGYMEGGPSKFIDELKKLPRS